MSQALRPIGGDTLERFLRYGLVNAGQRLFLRPGCRPLLCGVGKPRELRFRQLTRDDTVALARFLLEETRVSERLAAQPGEAADALAPLLEMPGEALVEWRLDSSPAGLALVLELIPLLAHPAGVELVEP